MKNKKGVSLIAVLLFMLVATIAATATFKWLTSEGQSSASRLMLSEARQSAVAGIETARSWMTYHGNETGAIIKQYLSANKNSSGNVTPISLDDVLAPMTNGRQSFSVQVVGVDVSSSPYKIKLASTGTARNGTTFSEEAVLKVTGLYRVKTPSINASDLKLDYAIFGGSINYAGSQKVSALVVNGDWKGNPPMTTGDFVITGNAEQNGNDMQIGGTTCVGGTLKPQNQGLKTKNLYVGGTAVGGKYVVSGDAYIGGTMTPQNSVSITGSLTVEGSLTPGESFSIGKNLCMEKNGRINLNSSTFTVPGNVWIPDNGIPFLSGGNPLSSTSSAAKVVLGDDETDLVYVNGAHRSSDYADLRESKKFVEKPEYRKKCEENFQMDGVWHFEDGTGWLFNGTGDYNVCGHQAWNWNPEDHVDFTDRWSYWQDYTYYAYDVVSPSTNLYYIYRDDVMDVEFKSYDNPYWWSYKGDKGSSFPVTMELNKDYVNPNDRASKFKSHFSNPTPIWAYFVGGQVYNDLDPKSTRPTYNYENGKPTNSPYCIASDDPYRPKCAIATWFRSEGTVEGDLPSTAPFSCAESVKAHCDSIWGAPKPGCTSSSKYKVDNLLKVAYDSFKEYANRVDCSKNLTKFKDNNDLGGVVSQLNSCYASAVADPEKAKDLYNGFLVVEFSGNQNANPQETLTGNFIIIFNNSTGKLRLPPSTGTTLVYLKEGAGDVLPAMKEANGSGDDCYPGTYNYFVYSKKDISQLMQFRASTCQLHGTIYLDADNCAKIGTLNNREGGSGEFMVSNSDLINALGQATILCPADKETCGGVNSGASSSAGASTANFGGYDTDFISTGAQLKIELESQYKNEETYEESEDVNKSIIVMPRIIYLNKDATGKLSDYYTVMPLNGATANGSGAADCGSFSTGSFSSELDGGPYHCSYTEGDYTSDFYIVITGKMSETPTVRFSGEGKELNSVSDNEEVLSLDVSSSTGTGTFKVYIEVSQVEGMSGWTISPTAAVKEHSSSGGKTIYVYEGTASSSNLSVPVFNIKVDNGASPGSVSFRLQEDSENCIPMWPSYAIYSLSASATIVRESLDDYCSVFECDESLKREASRANCDEEGGVWVSAEGVGCTSDMDNKKWYCGSGNSESEPITLVEMAGYDNSLCEVVIPTANNSIVGAEKEKEYTLYASLKKRMYNLHVSLRGSTGAAAVEVYTGTGTGSLTKHGESCTNADGCDYSIPAGTTVQIKATGEEFSYWSCLGGGCSAPTSTINPLQFVMLGDRDYRGEFNETDAHCFYTEFSKVSRSFCADGENECIDKCEGSQTCNSGAGAKGSTPNWLMVRANQDGGFLMPDMLGGYVSREGRPTLLLSRVLAGGNGYMTARIMTDRLSTSRAREFSGNGLVLRSNVDGTSLLLVNVYGSEGEDNAHVRLCYVADGTPDVDKCIDKVAKNSSGDSPSISSGSAPVDVKIDLDGDRVIATLRLHGSSAEAAFNLGQDWKLGSLNDADHRYVGLMLSDREFKVSDIGWRANDFPNDVCFGYPSISCSFEANFPSGKVPVNETVSPWVGFSSLFFGEHDGCLSEAGYYYNGCDVPSSNFSGYSSALTSACPDESSAGLTDTVSTDHPELKLQSKDYFFLKTGQHGTVTSSPKGRARNAFVEVTCESVFYNSSCGEFFVGEKTGCSKNVVMAKDVSGSSYWTPHEVGLVNLRDANIDFDIKTLDDGQYIEAVLEDKDGALSPARSVNRSNHVLSASDFEGLSGFDIEKVETVRLRGSSSYEIRSVSSKCPNAVGIECQSASYSGENWTVFTNITNKDNAYKCRVKTESDSDISGSDDFVDCNSMKFTVSDPTFYERFNTDPDREPEISYKFIVEVFDVANPNDNEIPADSCVAESQVYKHASVNCYIDEDEKNVVQTMGMPTFHYEIKNCPETGCNYSVVLDNGALSQGDGLQAPQAGKTDDWLPDYNTSDGNKLSTDYRHSYTVKIWGGDPANTFDNCTEFFDVDKIREVDGNCLVNQEEGTLTVNITGANYGEATTVSLVSNDVLGNILGFSTVAVGTNPTTTIDLSTNPDLVPGQTYPFQLKLGSNKVEDCGSYYKPYELTLKCPDDVPSPGQPGQKAEEALTVTPTVSGCGSACTWTLSGTGVTLSGTDYNGGALTPFTNEGQDGNKITYTIQLSRVGAAESKSCDFTVQYRENTNITATCAWDNGTGTYWPGQTNVKLNVSNIRNLPSDQKFELTCGDKSTSSYCRVGGNCDNLQFKVPSTVGNYTCILQNSSGDVMCRPAMEIKAPLNCSVSSNAVGYGETFTFSGSTASGTNCWSCKWSDGSNSHSVGTSFSQNITFNYTTERTYTFQCDCSEMDSPQKCTQTVVSHLDPPTVTCPQPHYTADPGTPITFTPANLTNCGIGCNYTLVKDGSSTPKASKTDNSYTSASAITFTGDNVTGDDTKYFFIVENSAGKDTCDFYVDYKKPVITTCPASVSGELGGSIFISPAVSNCSNCSYKIKKSDGTTLPNGTGSNYNGSGDIQFTGESTTGKKTYTFEVSNGATGGTASCDFEVTYYEPEIDCPSSSDSEFNVEPGATFTYPISGKVEHCSSNCVYAVSGGLSPSAASYTGGSLKLSSESGGRGTKTYSFNVGNGLTTSNSCTIKVNYKSPEITSCPDPDPVEPGGKVSFNPVIDNCSSGCSYSIDEVGGSNIIPSSSYTGSNQISFNGANNRTSNSYVFKVTNSAGEYAYCDFSVNYLKPTFSCPGDQTVAAGNSVTVAPSNVSNCRNGCSYTITGGTHGGASGSNYTSGNFSSISGEYPSTTSPTTYTLTMSNAAGSGESCTFDVTYTVTPVVADCWFEKNSSRKIVGFPGSQYDFKVYVSSGITSNTTGTMNFNGSRSIQIYSAGQTYNWSNYSLPTTTGVYPYSVTYNGNVICSGSIEVKDYLTCSVSPSNVEKGDTYTFSASKSDGVDNCWSCTYTYDSGTENNANLGTSYTKTASSTGTKTLKMSCTCDNRSAQCTKTLTVSAPSISIASCAGNQDNVTIGSTVNFKPTVSNCDGSCSWELYEGSSRITGGSSYNGTSQLSFSGSDYTGTKNYTFKVSKDGVNKECNFSVTYVEPPSSSSEASSSSAATEVCHCTCPSGCNNVITSGWNSGNTSGCYFTTDGTANAGLWNGTTININGSSYSNTQVTFSSVAKKDGGYYYQFTSYHYPSFSSPGGGTPVCSGGGGSTSSASTTSSSSAGGGSTFACNGSNSTSAPGNVNAGTCYYYQLNSGTLRIGNWSGQTLTMTYQDCSGTVKTASIKNSDWTGVPTSGACKVYFTFDKSVGLQYGAW